MKMFKIGSALLILSAFVLSSCLKTKIEQLCCLNEYKIINTNYVLPDSFSLYIPQAFTPNGDGVNDIFLPIGREFEIDNLEIKKGNKSVYKSSARIEAFWDGGDEKDGQYTYDLTIRLSNNDKLDIKGNVCLFTVGEVGSRLHDVEREKICTCVMGDMLNNSKGVIRETSECPSNQ